MIYKINSLAYLSFLLEIVEIGHSNAKTTTLDVNFYNMVEFASSLTSIANTGLAATTKRFCEARTQSFRVLIRYLVDLANLLHYPPKKLCEDQLLEHSSGGLADRGGFD